MAARLDVSVGTINGDFKAINEQWAQETTMDVDAEKQIDLARIDALIVALWDKARDGDERAIAQVLNLMQHRAKLLGLNAPEKRELSGDENAPLTVLIQRVTREVPE